MSSFVSSSRSITARAAVSGVAGLASLFAVSPGALATDNDSQPDVENDLAPTAIPTNTPPTPSDPTPFTSSASSRVQPAAVADFGVQKYRVGVQIDDGSWVPEGTTTVGTTFTVTETGPNVDGGSRTFTCTTQASTVTENSTASFCTNPDLSVSNFNKASNPPATIDQSEDDIPEDQLYVALPGSTVTFSQSTAAPNLVGSTDTPVLQPCDDLSPFAYEGDWHYCEGSGRGLTLASTILFTNGGLPPVAADDSESTDPETPVDIDVLLNDDTMNGAPLTKIEQISKASHGRVVLNPARSSISASGVNGARTFTYTPRSGFSGVDTFDYAIETPNGRAVATVTIDVAEAGTVTDQPDKSATEQPQQQLPNVGGPDATLALAAASLLGAGGALMAAGRRRRPASHDAGA